MKSVRLAAVLAFIAVVVAPLMRADVTVRYKNEVKVGSGAPPMVTQMLSTALENFQGKSTVIQIKGSKAYTTTGPFITTTDLAKQLITLIDPAHKQYVTLFMKDYKDQVLATMATPATSAETQKILDSMKATFSSEKTGRTDNVMGVQVEETRMVLTVEEPRPAGMPAPAGAPSTDAAQTAPTITIVKMVMQVWTALPSEVERVPAIKEFASAYNYSNTESLLNANGLFEKGFSGMGGMGSGLKQMMDELSKTRSLTLRTHMEMSMPIFAEIALPASGDDKTPSVDPKAPVLEMNVDTVELSTAPIDDSVFEVPADCHVATLADFLQAINSAPKAPAATQPSGSQ